MYRGLFYAFKFIGRGTASALVGTTRPDKNKNSLM